MGQRARSCPRSRNFRCHRCELSYVSLFAVPGGYRSDQSRNLATYARLFGWQWLEPIMWNLQQWLYSKSASNLPACSRTKLIRQNIDYTLPLAFHHEHAHLATIPECPALATRCRSQPVRAEQALDPTASELGRRRCSSSQGRRQNAAYQYRSALARPQSQSTHDTPLDTGSVCIDKSRRDG